MRIHFTKEITQPLKVIMLGLLLGVGANYVSAAPWVGPISTPPSDSIPAPINGGPAKQTKTGALNVATTDGTAEDFRVGILTAPSYLGKSVMIGDANHRLALELYSGQTSNLNWNKSLLAWSGVSIFGDLTNVGSSYLINGTGGGRSNWIYGDTTFLKGPNPADNGATQVGSVGMGSLSAPLSLTLNGAFKYVTNPVGVAGSYLMLDASGNAVWSPGQTGPTGPAGVDGNTWTTNSTNPSASGGAVGDLFYNFSTDNFYKKTNATTWTLQGNLVGPQGVQGTAGAQGTQGQPGVSGTISLASPAAITGAPLSTPNVRDTDSSSSSATLEFTIPRGETGDRGPNGPKGPQGYEVVPSSTSSAFNFQGSCTGTKKLLSGGGSCGPAANGAKRYITDSYASNNTTWSITCSGNAGPIQIYVICVNLP